MADLFGAPEIATQSLDGEKGRTERGAFYTPDKLAEAICAGLGEGEGPAFVFEPGCGGGAFLRAARGQWPKCFLVGVDLQPACDGPGLVSKRDLFEVDGQPDLILGNPDYAIAERVVRHCLGLLAPGGHLAFLLRLAFLGSEGRAALYREHPLRYLMPIAQRPSFTGGGSDPMEYGLFIWQQGFDGRGELVPPLVWR